VLRVLKLPICSSFKHGGWNKRTGASCLGSVCLGRDVLDNKDKNGFLVCDVVTNSIGRGEIINKVFLSIDSCAYIGVYING
jgi:hypothetical protein